MVRTRSRPHRGFTLVEILVVLGIIAILAALLLPAAMQVVTRSRNAAIAIEVSQLADAVESYKQDKGDYPPNFRDYQAFIRHVRRCYPKIDQRHLDAVIITVWGASPPAAGAVPTIDEGESLVFWLSLVDNDPRQPFKYIAFLSAVTTPIGTKPLPPPNPKKYYDFDITRADPTAGDGDGFASFTAKYCKDSYYLYIDSRSYLECAKFSNAPYSDPSPPGNQFAYAEDSTNYKHCARPYWSDTPSGSGTNLRDKNKSVNPTSFQILCAGQDGDFGLYDKLETTITPDVKLYPSGFNYSDSRADHDNITNFSNAKRLEDNIPQQ